MSYQLGIDLGTTFTAAAVCRSQRGGSLAAEPVTLGTAAATVPSVLYLGADGAIVVGEAAERRALTEPDRVVREFKRRIGDITPYLLGGREYRAHELAALLVRWVTDRASERTGGPPAGITVTHPATWGRHKQELLAHALERIGRRVTFLAEPQAAALSYASAERVAPGSTIAVYDLGGGTFDAAVVRKNGTFSLLGDPEGIERLGGLDFDDLILGAIKQKVGEELWDALDPADPAVINAVAQLRRECVEAKIALSTDIEVTIPVLLPELRGKVKLTRGQFEGMIRGPLQSTIDALQLTIRSAGLTAADLSAVLLVGGSSRIPLVADLVTRDLGRPVALDVDPQLAIAMGAAISADAARGVPVEVPAAVGSSVETAAPPAPEVPPSPAAPPWPPPNQPAAGFGGQQSGPPAPTEQPAWPVPQQQWPGPPAPPPYEMPGSLPPGGFGQPMAAPTTGPAGPTTGPLPMQPSRPVAPAPPPRPEGAPAALQTKRRRGSRRTVLVVVALVVVLGAAAAVGLIFFRDRLVGGAGGAGGGRTPVLAAPAVEATINVGSQPDGVAISPDGKRVYVTNAGSRSVSVIDADAKAVVAEVPTDDPVGVAVTPDGKRVYVVNKNTDSVVAVDTASNEVVQRIQVGNGPVRIAIGADGKFAYVTNRDAGTLSVIELGTGKVTGTIKVADRPDHPTFSPDGRLLYVTSPQADAISVVDPATASLRTTIPVAGGPFTVAFSRDGQRAYIVNNGADAVSTLDLASNTILRTIPVGDEPVRITAVPNTDRMFVTNVRANSVSVIDAASDKVVGTVQVGASPSDAAVTSDGKRMYVTNLGAQTVSVIDTGLR